MKIINVSKKFIDGNKEKIAVNNINLTLNKGLTFFVGKSGSGKSTLLNLIAGFELPSSGSIILDDIDITKLNNNELNKYIRFNVGYIAQDYHLIEDFTTKDNILLGNDNISQDSEEFKNIVKELELDSLLEKKVIKLSGGEKQRVAIARVLLRNSRIILADEPTGNLDEENSKIIFNYLKKLSKDRIVIVVSHDNESAKTYRDRIIGLKDGSIVSDSNKKEIKEEKDNIVLDGNYKFSIIKLFKYAFSFLFSKKVLLFLSTLICGIAFGISSTLTSFALYDDDKTIMKLVEEDPANYFNITKNYIQLDGARASRYNLPISKEEIKEFRDEFNFVDYEVRFTSYVWRFYSKDTGLSFIQNCFNTIVIFNNPYFLDKYDWSLGWGYMPTKDNEFLLTDYALFSMYTMSPHYLDELLGVSYVALKSDEGLINAINGIDEDLKIIIFGENYEEEIKKPETIKRIRKNPGLLLVGNEFIMGRQNQIKRLLTGYIDTGLVDKYYDIIYTLNENFDYSNQRMVELRSILMFSSVFSFFALEGFQKNAIDKLDYTIIDGSTQYRFPIDRFNEFGTDYHLENGEILMSDTEFRRLFQKEFDPSEEMYYDVTLAEFYDTRITNNMVYSKRFKIKQVIELNETVNEYIYGNGAIVMTESDFNDYKETIDNNSFCEFIINKNELNKFNLKNPLVKEKGYTLVNFVLQTYYFSRVGVGSSLMFTLFKVATIIFGIIGVALLFIYFLVLIIKRKRDIGILKTLGVKNKEISIIFYFTGILYFIISLITLILFSILSYLLFNYFVSKMVIGYSLFEQANMKSLFSINPLYVFLFSLAFLVLIGVIVFITTNKVKRIKPMDSIKSI